MALKIIGAGFGRTGTASIQLALEKLGFEKCYHMYEIRNDKSKAQAWYDASIKKPVDWDDVFTGYQATIDWPACSFYKDLIDKYPNAKVILTVRDPDKWYKSVRDTIYIMSNILPWWAYLLSGKSRIMRKMISNVIWDGTFNGRFEQEDYAKNVFLNHIEQVKNTVAKEKLLIYEVTQGWQPLCDFLNLPIPEGEAFPNVNDTNTMKQLIRDIKFKINCFYIFLIFIFSAILIYIF